MNRNSILKLIVTFTVSTMTVLSHNGVIVNKAEESPAVIKKFNSDKHLEESKQKEEALRKQREKELALAKEQELKKQQELEKERILKEEQRKKEEEEWIPVRISYYTNSYEDCSKTNAISASGKNLNRGGNYVAAPKDIPFGTNLYIESLNNTYTVEDRGGAIKWRNGVMWLDVYIPNTSQEHIGKLGVEYTRAKIIK